MSKNKEGISYYQRLKERGVCAHCAKNRAVPGKVLCTECAKKAALENRAERLWYKEHRICPICRTADAALGRVSCAQCLQKRRIYNKKRRSGRQQPPEAQNNKIRC